MRYARVTTLVAVAVLASSVLLPGAQARPSAGERGCDPIDPALCLLPFPNNWHTSPDPDTDTGLRVDFDPAAMPRNAQGVGIDPAEWNRNDGFSPGSMVLAQVPGIDLEETGAAPVTDIGSSLDPDAPIVLLDMDTGERWPYWAELDSNATEPDRRALIVRPARNFLEGHRYAVALRDLKDGKGKRIAAGADFRKVAGKKLSKGHALHERQRQLRPVLDSLRKKAGVRAEGLHLAWDFTVASRRSLSERMLHIRDDSFDALGDRAPEYLAAQVTENDADDPIARSVRGLFNVPGYLDSPRGLPGSGFHYGSDGLPARQPGHTQIAAFQCEIPRSALTRAAQPSLYGHGLLGRDQEVGSASIKAMAAEHNIVFCATKWAGMSEDDLGHVARVLGDLSDFHTVADRTQQGVLNGLWLGRLMTHEDGFAADAAFQGEDGAPVIDTDQPLGFYGNSQGAILGGMLTAVSTEVERAALGVPGMNFSTLLNRSKDFAAFQPLLDAAYPDKLEQQLGFGLIQMLWDRGEANGYAQHMTDDGRQVLMHVAFGDHQVSPTAAEVQARTIGASIHTPAVADGRNPDKEPYWDLEPLDYPDRGSGIVIWDSGSPYQPLGNIPPTQGHNPHGDTRNSADSRRQMAVFLSTGEIIDVCGGAPCTAAPAN